MWTPKDVELAMSHLSKHVRAKTERSRVNMVRAGLLQLQAYLDNDAHGAQEVLKRSHYDTCDIKLKWVNPELDKSEARIMWADVEAELVQTCLDSGWRLRLGTPDIWVASFFGLWPRLRVEVVAGLSKAGVV